jgi:hypothetical protein
MIVARKDFKRLLQPSPFYHATAIEPLSTSTTSCHVYEPPKTGQLCEKRQVNIVDQISMSDNSGVPLFMQEMIFVL